MSEARPKTREYGLPERRLDAAKAIKHAGWERRVQTAMLTLLVAGVIWVVQTLAAVTVDIAAIRPRVDTIDVQVAGMYTARDARRDFADIDHRLGGMAAASAARDARISGLEERVGSLEGKRPSRPHL